jgi:hypothetical protein
MGSKSRRIAQVIVGDSTVINDKSSRVENSSW